VLYGNTEKHKTFDMRVEKHTDMLLEGQQDMHARVGHGYATASDKTINGEFRF
jgi:hypothetical protein